MAWQPKNNALDTSGIEKNLDAFIAANQAAALLWSSGGAALKRFYFIAESLADLNKPNLPSLAVVGTSETEASDDDLLVIDYRIDYESIVFGKDAGALPAITKKYANALKSMLKNISAIELLADVPGQQKLLGVSVNVNYRDLAEAKKAGGFIQVFEVRAVYRLLDSAYI